MSTLCALAATLGPAIFAAAGCATNETPLPRTAGHIECLDDSPECIARRQGVMKQLAGDASRAWMRESPTPEAYASGVRLYAIKTKKRELSCDELQRGKLEADGAPGSLRAASNKLTPAQISRGIMFASEVGRELTNEMGRRCKRT